MQNIDGECIYLPTIFMVTTALPSWDRMIKSSKKFWEGWLANMREIGMHHKIRFEYQNKDKMWSRQE